MTTRRTNILILLLLGIPLLSTLSFAANDPGHDILYVLKLGDSNVTGSINVSQNLTANYLAATVKLIGSDLDIWANGSTYTPSSRPAIQSTTTNLYIDPSSGGNLYFNTLGGTTGVVQVGPTTGSSVTLNVSGTITQQGVAICLANGTNCPAVTGNTTAQMIAAINNTVGVFNIDINASNVTNAPWLSSISYQSTAAGWTNTSTYTTTNLTMNVSNMLWVNTTNVGIGTTSPNNTLAVIGTINASGNVYDNGNRVCTAANGLCTNGSSSAGGWTNTSTTTSTTLNVSVTGNITATDTINTNKVIITGLTNTRVPYVTATGQLADSGMYSDGTSIGVGTVVNLTSYPGFDIYTSQNSATAMRILNGDTSDGAAKAQIAVGSNTTGGHYGLFMYLNAGWSSSGLSVPYRTVIMSGDTAGLAMTSGNGAYPVIFGINNIEKARFDTNGNFGINTSTPTQLLDVNGSANFSGANAQVWVNGSQVCTAANGLWLVQGIVRLLR